MKAFCINMEEAIGRKIHCEQQFKKEGIEAVYVRGFNARASKLSHEEAWITPPNIGCCLSHAMIAEEVRHNMTEGLVLVFEDDPVLEPRFMDRLRERLQTLPDSWDVAMISWFPDGGDYNALEWQSINRDWSKLLHGNVWGTGCYVINGSAGADNLLKCILPISSHIDRMFNESAKEGKLKSYFMNDRLAQPDWTLPSQIQGV